MATLKPMISFVVGIMFGVQVNDRYWLPRPDLNYLSWGFGFLIISAIFSMAAGVCMFKAAWDTYQTLLHKEDEYTKMALEMSVFPSEQVVVCPPMAPDQTDYGGFSADLQRSLPPSYSVNPPSLPLQTTTSYSSHPSDEKGIPAEWRASDSVEPDSVFVRPESEFYEIQARPAYNQPAAMMASSTGFGKSYDQQHLSDTSFADPELEEFVFKPERQY